MEAPARPPLPRRASQGPRPRQRILRFLLPRRFRPDAHGASEVVGSLLLVAITVILIAGLALLILNIKGPERQVHADLAVSLHRGADGVWGSGDEELRITHRGGNAVPADGFSVQVTIDGTTQSFAGAGLGGTFADGRLTVGETWVRLLTVPEHVQVDVLAVLDTGTTSRILLDITLAPGNVCFGETDPPQVALWAQTPADLTALHMGPVTVTVTLSDACSGVDEAVPPHLEYRIHSGTEPPYTSLGAMTQVGPSQWTGTIPDQTWLLQLGNTLQYRVSQMTDLAGNVGTSSVQSDAIQLIGTNTYPNPSGYTANMGTVEDFGNLRSASDAGALATFTEGLVPGGGTVLRYASTGTTGTGSSGATNPQNAAGAPDGVFASMTSTHSSNHVTVSGFSVAGQTAAITKVEMITVMSRTGLMATSSVTLRVTDAAGTFQNAQTGYIPPLNSFGENVVDITNHRAGGVWTWTDVQDVQLRAFLTGSLPPEVRVDSMVLRVTTPSAQYAMDIEVQFPPVLGSLHVLEMRYHAVGDTFRVQVWNGPITGWVTRGAPLDQTSQATWVYQLAPAEVAPLTDLAPRIRILDNTPTGTSQGTLFIDYVRVVSA